MGFPTSAYTSRGGVGTVAAHAKVEAARTPEPDPDDGQEPFAQAA
jgi:ParB family chromosome partitioning protein